MKKIGIVGNGYVGGATALLAHSGVSVHIYDTDLDKCSSGIRGLEDLTSSPMV